MSNPAAKAGSSVRWNVTGRTDATYVYHGRSWMPVMRNSPFSAKLSAKNPHSTGSLNSLPSSKRNSRIAALLVLIDVQEHIL